MGNGTRHRSVKRCQLGRPASCKHLNALKAAIRHAHLTGAFEPDGGARDERLVPLLWVTTIHQAHDPRTRDTETNGKPAAASERRDRARPVIRDDHEPVSRLRGRRRRISPACRSVNEHEVMTLG